MATFAPGIAITSEQLTEFTLFPKLAIELRLKIFKHALPTGRKGIRMLKVAAERVISVNNSTTQIEVNGTTWMNISEQTSINMTISCYVTLRLLEHQDNAYIQDVGLLGACSEYVMLCGEWRTTGRSWTDN
jgi:hypothetical protein